MSREVIGAPLTSCGAARLCRIVYRPGQFEIIFQAANSLYSDHHRRKPHERRDAQTKRRVRIRTHQSCWSSRPPSPTNLPSPTKTCAIPVIRLIKCEMDGSLAHGTNLSLNRILFSRIIMSSDPTASAKLAPFTPSGDGVLAFALELLKLESDDVLFDLGCGDGRMLVHAAKESGARFATRINMVALLCSNLLLTQVRRRRV